MLEKFQMREIWLETFQIKEIQMKRLQLKEIRIEKNRVRKIQIQERMEGIPGHKIYVWGCLFSKFPSVIFYITTYLLPVRLILQLKQ